MSIIIVTNQKHIKMPKSIENTQIYDMAKQWEEFIETYV